MDVEIRAARLILHGETPLVPLSELHRSLAAEAGGEAGDLATLRQRLGARPDLFLLLERPSPLTGAEHWPEADRVAYRCALREAGFEAETLVGANPQAVTGAAGAGAPGSPPGDAAGRLHTQAIAPAPASTCLSAPRPVHAPTTTRGPASSSADGRRRLPAASAATAPGSTAGDGQRGPPARWTAPTPTRPVAPPAPARSLASAPPAAAQANHAGEVLRAALPPAPAAPATPAARVAAALAQLAASLPEEHALRGRLADALPMAEATMRVLAEAWRARQQAEQEGWVPPG